MGSDLNVKAVLTGKISQRGEDLAITVELVDVRDNSIIWGQPYNRMFAEILEVQNEIVENISSNLRLTLNVESQQLLTKSYTENTEAYQAYLMGRYYWNKRTEEGLKKSLEYFQKAIEEDPSYALAYTGIADSYNILGWWGYLSPEDTYPKAKDATRKALRIDDMLAEAHTALASTSLYYDWDWFSFESEIKLAIELNPIYAEAHKMYGAYLMIMGKLNEAIIEVKRAQELDPLYLVPYWLLSRIYHCLGRNNEAMEQCQKAIEIDPNFGIIYNNIGTIYSDKGNYKEAIKYHKKAVELMGEFSRAEGCLGFTYGISGERDKAEQLLQKLKEMKENKYIPSSSIAYIYVGLGENDKAFEWLDKAYEERDPSMPYNRIMHELDNIRSEDRFKVLLKKMGLGN